MARLMGTMAIEQVPKNNSSVEGVIVNRNYKYNLYQSNDLKEFEGINEVPISQKVRLPYYNTLSLLLFHLQTMYGIIEHSTNSYQDNIVKLLVFNSVELTFNSDKSFIELDWSSSTLNDMVADSIVAMLLNIDCSPVSVKITSSSCNHSHNHAKSFDAEKDIVHNTDDLKYEKLNPIGENTELKFEMEDIEDLDTSKQDSEFPLNFKNEFLDINCRVDPSLIPEELADFLCEQFAIVEMSTDKEYLLIKEQFDSEDYSAKIALSNLVPSLINFYRN
ncbi:Endoribonuclease ysh1 [Smittium mucronatum]|uniref:Endoribonuclease ysh1 n=1 Tax=Smittium mucronatum TaxID=133383 RepID=A0A1R0H311_9FUNG|nr:Endoribonuclease ysh1 [Smittium mucronatum]